MPSGGGAAAEPRNAGREAGFVGVCFSTRRTAVVTGAKCPPNWRVPPAGEANLEGLGAARGSGGRVVDSVDFGIIACERSVPHVAGMFGAAVADLFTVALDVGLGTLSVGGGGATPDPASASATGN